MKVGKRTDDGIPTSNAANIGQPGVSVVTPKLGSELGNLTALTASSSPSNVENCDTQITPACLRALYKFGDYKQRAWRRNSYGIGDSAHPVPRRRIMWLIIFF